LFSEKNNNYEFLLFLIILFHFIVNETHTTFVNETHTTFGSVSTELYLKSIYKIEQETE
jgi:hypothetical protein